MITLSFSRNRRMRTAGCLLVLGMIWVTAQQSRAQGSAAAPEAIAAPIPVDLTGSWSGHWDDCRSGHGGPLRAEFCKCDDCHYRVTFTGRFFKVFPFRYSVVLSVVSVDQGKVVLSGQNDLGLLFGTFSYQAEATATNFVANYSSCKYQGRFVLSRCCCR